MTRLNHNDTTLSFVVANTDERLPRLPFPHDAMEKSLRSKFKKLLWPKRDNDHHSTSPLSSADRPSSTGRSGSRVDKYGLHRLYPTADEAGASLALGSDIVAVHGLNGDAYRTWTHENEKLWLRDFLPASLPASRAFTFGYSSEVAFSKSRGSIDQYARSLLNALKLVRRTEVLKPAVLIIWPLRDIMLEANRRPGSGCRRSSKNVRLSSSATASAG